MIGISNSISIVGLPASILSGGTTPLNYPADTFTDMSFAFGLIKASSSYSGDCLEIQRDSDGAYNTVGWKPDGTADLSGVLAWAGTDTVTVTKVYDSTGNGNRAQNATAATQVVLASGGSLNLYDNQLWYSLKWYRIVTGGTNTPYYAARVDTYTVYTPQSSAGSQSIGLACADINRGASLISQASSSAPNINFGSPTYYQDGALKSWTTRTSVRNNAVVPLTRTQISVIGGVPTGQFNLYMNIGGAPNFTFLVRGGMTVWGWVKDTSSERTAIETMLNDKVNITV